jgi:hypothetical protein
MLSEIRTRDALARRPEVQAFLQELRASHSFYQTPKGSNDDW